MTALCGGGPSAPKQGVDTLIQFDATSVASALELLGFPELAALMAPAIVAVPILSATFCGTDPPADPGLTATDLTDALNFSVPSLSIPALAKFRQWFLHQYWYQICTCTTTTTPAPAAPSNPGVSIGINTGLPSNSLTGPCWDVTQVLYVGVGSPVSSGAGTNANSILPSNPAGYTKFDNPAGNIPVQVIPPGITLVSWTATIDSLPVVAGVGVDMAIFFFDASHNSVAGSLFPGFWSSTSSSLTVTGSGTIPSTAKGWYAVWDNYGDSNPHTVNIELSFTCSGGGTLASPCCPPDPSISAALQQILGIVSAIYSIVPIRPSAYVAATAHAGLTGNGSVSLAPTTIAVQVDFTTLPTVHGQVAGTPITILDLGWISPVTAYGAEAGIRLSRQIQTVPLPDAVSAVDYTLPPGAVATITELQSG